MAVKPNSTSEGSKVRLFTGVAQWKVVAINPGQEELKSIGYKAEKVPSYEKDGVHRVTFFLEGKAGNEVMKTNRSFFIKNKLRTDMFINNFGKFGKDRSKLGETARHPLDGEIDLVNFVADWCNINFAKEEPLSIDTIETIAQTGDVSELIAILEGARENTFQGLAIVRDGKYQGMFEKTTLRSWSTDLSYLHKSLVANEKYIGGEYGPIDLKLFVPSQFALREYTPTGGVAVDAAALPTTAHTSTNGAGTKSDAKGPEAPAAETDDTPF